MSTVLVTGANSVLGAAIVEQLLARGADVVATVRSDSAERTVRALEVPGDGRSSLVVERLDVTDTATARQVLRRHRPDVVINNAGSALLGVVADISDAEAHEQLDSVVVAPVRLAQLAISQGCTRVVQVGSIVASGQVPFTGWYAASKAALDTLSRVWRTELRERGVTLVMVECGAIDTDVWSQAGDTVDAADDPETARARRGWADAVQWLQPQFADPEVVADAIAGAALVERPPERIRVGFGTTAQTLARVLPERVVDTAVRWGLNATPALAAMIDRVGPCRRLRAALRP